MRFSISIFLISLSQKNNRKRRKERKKEKEEISKNPE